MTKEEKTWILIIETQNAYYTLAPEDETVILARTRIKSFSSGEISFPSLPSPRIEGKKPEDLIPDFTYKGVEAVITMGGVEIFFDDQRQNRIVKTSPVKAVEKAIIIKTYKKISLGKLPISVSVASPP